MPILRPDDPALKILRDRKWHVATEMPDTAEIYGEAVGQVSPGFLGKQWAFSGQVIYQEGSQMALGAVLENIGMPVIAIFRDILDALKIDVVGDMMNAVEAAAGSIKNAVTALQEGGEAAEAVMENSVEAGVGFAVDGIGMVPLVGWIVKIAWALVKFIKKIVLLARSSKDYGKVNVKYPDTMFNPQLDNIWLNEVLTMLRQEKDWSHLFGPPALGKGLGTLPDYWLRETTGGAVEITRQFGRDDEGKIMEWDTHLWTGMVPGATKLVRGIRVKGGSAEIIGPYFLPSIQNILFWVWSSVIGKKGNAGPAMYCVDPNALRSWSGYIGGLHEFIYETGGISNAGKESVMRVLNKDEWGKPIFGWGTGVKPRSNEHDNYLPWKMASALEERQFSFLDTLLVAYIDESYGAFQTNDSLRNKWVQRRKDLLVHPARCDVDLDNVPDSDYRQALRESGVDSGICMQAADSFAIATVPGFGGGGGGGPDANPFDKAPPREGGRAIGFLPLLALGAGAWYAYKKGYLAKLPLIT